ncbi:hypothetical protein BS47DRAFT_249577 [Hydnum rufescens UP504]|uniref:MMS19 nucleotide excision repair protein n=1 Tax=Hydnum rufescens UP504 TaxID=1448309 RepID=A0A9P6DNP8_9AGAM|nr:hypothetical protein BS47DRAFT_249577 [Hydnum rufescens UP504]
MQTCERLVRTYMSSERETDLSEIVSGVGSGTYTLLQVVQSLGEYLTAVGSDIRTKGVTLLSTVISECPPSRVSLQSNRVLTTFYCGKLDDPDTIEPTLKGLAALVTFPTFGDSGAVETIQA